MNFLRTPQQIWWRKAIFQIHLWIGLSLCLYMFVIGVTGAILVLEEQIENTFYRQLVDTPEGSGSIKVMLPEVVRNLHSSYPHFELIYVYLPESPGKNYMAFMKSAEDYFRVYVSPVSGTIVGNINTSRSWLSVVAGLHFRLLAGRIGLLLNGIGAVCLLILCASGIVIWWPGIRKWRRRLQIRFTGNWRRVTFDLHSSLGLWCLLILSMWAFTGVYLVWPRPVENLVSRFSSTASLDPPKFTVPPRTSGKWPSLESIILKAHVLATGDKFSGILFPSDDKDALIVWMSRGEILEFNRMDYLYFDPSTGKLLATWHRGQASTWGSRVLSWLAPLHLGIDFGLGIKIIWATIGCVLPVLAVTGVLMYWNRSLRKKWRALQRATKYENGGSGLVVSRNGSDKETSEAQSGSGSP